MTVQRAAVAFAGTPQFAVPSLRALLEAEVDVPLVLTQPDRPAGRGRQLSSSPVKQLALEHGLRVEQPARLRKNQSELSSWGSRPDLLVVVAYGLLLPQWLLDWPRVAAVNVHASLLPRWRGAAPIQRAILADDKETGVSIMRMEPGLDTGPVYARRAIPITEHETAATLHDKLAALGAQLLIATIPGILDGDCIAIEQDASAATYAPKLDKRDAAIGWSCDAASLARQVRAYNPWPVASAMLDDGRVLRIWDATALDAAAGATPGSIVALGPAGIEVATGSGRLRIERLQVAGGRPMSAAAYLNAHSLEGAHFAG